MGDKKAKSPLLYIHQPGIGEPEAPMQSHYMTPKKKQDDKSAESNKIKRQPVNRHFFNKQAEYSEEEATVESSEESPDQDEVKHAERKKFKDMTLKERVDYFLDAPKHAPTMRCEVKTDGRNYRGRIVDYQDDQVHMRIGRRTTLTEIPFDTIKEIRMLGF